MLPAGPHTMQQLLNTPWYAHTPMGPCRGGQPQWDGTVGRSLLAVAHEGYVARDGFR